MKIISKIKIHIFFYLAFILAIVTGNFKVYICITLITIFHEIGHIIGARILKWKIEKIIVMPFSMLTIFNIKVNSKMIEEFVVTILGPIFQIILLFFIKDSKIVIYNIYLLIFNLLPIYPLDGYKLFSIFLYNVISYKKAFEISLILSILFLLLLLYILKFNLIVISIFLIFIFKIINELNSISFIYNKFLLERYFYNDYSLKKKVLKSLDINKLFKYKYHYLIGKNRIYNEEEIIGKMFDNKTNV